MKKIVILSPYFGKFPNTIDITFETMKNNESIDWIVFTDNSGYEGKYPNIKFVKMSFADIRNLIDNKIGTSLSSAYKLCDYRPAYGAIFEKYIREYDFWGYCDLDVIFGDLRKFFTDQILNKYDKVYDLGHLSLYRNIKQVTYAFMGNENYHVPYKDIFNHKYNCIFDENYNENNRGINQVLERQGYNIYVNRNEIADIDIRFKNFHIHNREKNNDFYFHYEKGSLLLKRKNNVEYKQEISYAHYQQRKGIPMVMSDKNYFISTPKMFADINELSDAMFFEKSDFNWKTYINYRIKRYFNKLKARVWQKTHSDISKYDFKLP